MSILERFLSNYKPLIAVPVIITLIALALIATHGITENIDLKEVQMLSYSLKNL